MRLLLSVLNFTIRHSKALVVPVAFAALLIALPSDTHATCEFEIPGDQTSPCKWISPEVTRIEIATVFEYPRCRTEIRIWGIEKSQIYPHLTSIGVGYRTVLETEWPPHVRHYAPGLDGISGKTDDIWKRLLPSGYDYDSYPSDYLLFGFLDSGPSSIRAGDGFISFVPGGGEMVLTVDTPNNAAIALIPRAYANSDAERAAYFSFRPAYGKAYSVRSNPVPNDRTFLSPGSAFLECHRRLLNEQRRRAELDEAESIRVAAEGKIAHIEAELVTVREHHIKATRLWLEVLEARHRAIEAEMNLQLTILSNLAERRQLIADWYEEQGALAEDHLARLDSIMTSIRDNQLSIETRRIEIRNAFDEVNAFIAEAEAEEADLLAELDRLRQSQESE